MDFPQLGLHSVGQNGDHVHSYRDDFIAIILI